MANCALKLVWFSRRVFFGNDFIAKFASKSCLFLSFRQYLVEVESNYKYVLFFIYFFCTCSVMSGSIRNSKPNSRWFTRYERPMFYPLFGWPSSHSLVFHCICVLSPTWRQLGTIRVRQLAMTLVTLSRVTRTAILFRLGTIKVRQLTGHGHSKSVSRYYFPTRNTNGQANAP